MALLLPLVPLAAALLGLRVRDAALLGRVHAGLGAATTLGALLLGRVVTDVGPQALPAGPFGVDALGAVLLPVILATWTLSGLVLAAGPRPTPGPSGAPDLLLDADSGLRLGLSASAGAAACLSLAFPWLWLASVVTWLCEMGAGTARRPARAPLEGAGLAVSAVGLLLVHRAYIAGDGATMPETFASMVASAPGAEASTLGLGLGLCVLGWSAVAGLLPAGVERADAIARSAPAQGALRLVTTGGVALLALCRVASLSYAAFGPTGTPTLLLGATGLLTLLCAGAWALRAADLHTLASRAALAQLGAIAFGLALGPRGVGASLVGLVALGPGSLALRVSAGRAAWWGGSARLHRIRGLHAETTTAMQLSLGLVASAGMAPFLAFDAHLSLASAALDSPWPLAGAAQTLGWALAAWASLGPLSRLLGGRALPRAPREPGDRRIEVLAVWIAIALLAGLGLGMPSGLERLIETAAIGV